MITSPTTRSAPSDETSEQKPSTYLGAVKTPKPAASPNRAVLVVTDVFPSVEKSSLHENGTEDGTLSSVMDTQSNVTHQELESVVSSWVDDDDYFMQAAMQDITVTTSEQQQHRPVTLHPAPEKGWKLASTSGGQRSSQNPSGGRRGHQQRRGGAHHGSSHQAGNSTAPSANVSGGRFDALMGDAKRRW